MTKGEREKACPELIASVNHARRAIGGQRGRGAIKHLAGVPQHPTVLTVRLMAWLGMTAAIVWAIAQAGWGQADLFNPGGLPQLLQFFQASLQPDLSPDFLRVILRATGVTFAYAVCGTFLSLALGFMGGLLSAEIWWRTLLPPAVGKPIWVSIRGLLAFPRAIHELIWGLFFVNIFGLDPLVGVVAIAIPFGAIVAKVFSEILDETDHRPLKALLHSGAPPLAAVLYGLLPQALPNLLSYSFYRFECALRAAAVLGIIGVGGLGYEIFLSLQSLRYEQLWTGFYVLILLNSIVDSWSAFTRKQLGLANRINLKKSPNLSPAPPARSLSAPKGRNIIYKSQIAQWGFPLSLSCALLTIPLCFWLLPIDWSQLWSPQTGQLLSDILTAAKPATLRFNQVSTLVSLAIQTVAMSVLAIALASLGGLLLSFLSAQNLWQLAGLGRPSGLNRNGLGGLPWTVRFLSRLLLLVSRAIPAPIWALVFLFVVLPGILPGALALAVHNFGILGRLMAEVNENLDERPVKALEAMGISWPQIICYSILPQNLTQFMAYSLYRWEICLRETVIVGLVGAGGLGRLLTEQLSSFDYAEITVTLGMFVILTLLIDLISTTLRKALR